jgi:alpha-beta hydrolase superfamily lysophospholipase
MVEDVFEHYSTVRASYDPALPAFVIGESMGGPWRGLRAFEPWLRDALTLLTSITAGAVTIKLSFRDEAAGGKLGLSGAVLLAPMVKISDKMRPPELVVNALKAIAPLVPALPAVPAPEVMAKVRGGQAWWGGRWPLSDPLACGVAWHGRPSGGPRS